MKLKQLTLSLLTFCIATVAGTRTAEAVSLTVIADGLNNARGLSFSPDGALYVTESGSGGSGACVPSPGVPGASLCYGSTGAVTRILNGQQERVLTGLPSIALADGTESAGPQDIAFDSDGNAFLLMGYAGDPSLRDSVLNVSGLGELLRVDFNTNSWTSIADIGNYESLNNPDGEDVASNPFALQIQGDTAYVIDAAANDLFSVGTDGSSLTLEAVFPSRILTNPIFPPSLPTPPQFPIQSVPTGVAIGPDGAYYVSELTGFPFPEGEARIYRVGPDGQPTVYADGFTQLIDLEFDAQGDLYVLEHSTESIWKNNPSGSLIRLSPDGTRETIITGDSLFFPTAMTLGSDGAIYVANQGSLPGQGQVLRIDPTTSVPEPASTLSLLAFGALGVGSLLKSRRVTR